MAQGTDRSLDERLLTHHPAGRACLEICTANGWRPESGDLVRLVRLWDEVRQGRRSEAALSRARLGFARWLVSQGRLNEGSNAPDGAKKLAA
jgi:hypothetical protein